MSEPLTIYDRGCAAHLLCSGIPLLRVIEGDWQRFEFLNEHGQAEAALATWKNGTAQVNARDYWKALKELRMFTKSISCRLSANGKDVIPVWV